MELIDFYFTLQLYHELSLLVVSHSTPPPSSYLDVDIDSTWPTTISSKWFPYLAKVVFPPRREDGVDKENGIEDSWSFLDPTLGPIIVWGKDDHLDPPISLFITTLAPR